MNGIMALVVIKEGFEGEAKFSKKQSDKLN